MRVLAAIMALALLAGCDSEGDVLLFGSDTPSGPVPPDTFLAAEFTGIFTPCKISADGRCSLVLENQTTGGDPFEPGETTAGTRYLNTWSIAWRDQAIDLRGYPNQDTVRMELSCDFGPGGFPIDLTCRDEQGSSSTAEANPLLDCASDSVLTFSGS